MTTTTNESGLTTDHSRAVADGAHTHGVGDVPQASRAERKTSFDVADFPVPTGREEEWRFAPSRASRRCSPRTATACSTGTAS